MKNGILKEDYETLVNAYDFCLDCDGFLCGLVAGDMGWDQTSIQLLPNRNRHSRHLDRLVETIPCILYDYVRWLDGIDVLPRLKPVGFSGTHQLKEPMRLCRGQA